MKAVTLCCLIITFCEVTRINGFKINTSPANSIKQQQVQRTRRNSIHSQIDISQLKQNLEKQNRMKRSADNEESESESEPEPEQEPENRRKRSSDDDPEPEQEPETDTSRKRRSSDESQEPEPTPEEKPESE
jgi:hypothetical protein